MPTNGSTVRAIRHLADLADTDILPPLFEFQFHAERSDEIATKLEHVDFGEYKPRSCFEVLSPKTRLSFKIAHQLYPTDTLLYTSAVLDVAASIEAMRIPLESGAFSYSYDDDEASSQLYKESGSYHDWLIHVQSLCAKENPFEEDKYIVETDIADFYPRIYFHRIEHILDDCQATNAVRKIIEGIIKFTRAHQSYGLPVGSAASRLLAEAILNDTDRMLDGLGLKFARYVDDFRIVTNDATHAHSTLCRLAEHLMVAEGLSLNAAKTKVLPASDEIQQIEEKLTDVFSSSELAGLNRYISLVYEGGDISAEDIEDINTDELVSKLTEILARDAVDYSAVKVILKALRAVDVDDPAAITSKFDILLYYVPRDFCILVGTLAQKYPHAAEDLAQRLVELVVQAPFNDMALCKIWVAHLFISQALPLTNERLSQLNLTSSAVERRLQILGRAILEDRAYLREQKTRFSEVSDWEKPALILAMSRLPRSEFDTWVKNIVVAYFNDILGEIYISWVKENRSVILDKLKVDYMIRNKRRTGDEFTSIFDDLDLENLPPF